MDSLFIILLIWVFSSLFNAANKKNKKPQQKPLKPWLPTESKEIGAPGLPTARRAAKDFVKPIPDEQMGANRTPSYDLGAETTWQERGPALDSTLVRESVSLEGTQLIEGPSLEEAPLDQANHQVVHPSLLLPTKGKERKRDGWRGVFTCCNQNDIVKGLVMAEILGPPLAKRKKS